jgi:peroxiredoxin
MMVIAVADARLMGQNQSSAEPTKPAGGSSDRRSNPDPRKIIRQLADFYKRCKRIEVRCELIETERGQKEKAHHPNAATFSITAERPSRLCLQANWETVQFGLVCDAKTLWSWVGPPRSLNAGSDPVPKLYWQGEAPLSLAEVVENRLSMGSMGWPEQPLVLQLLTDDPYEDLLEGVKAISYVGEEKLDGIRVHRVKFARDVFSWEACIAAEGDPVLQKVAIDTTSAVMFMTGGRFGKVSATITQRFKDWRLDQTAKPDAFVFRPAAQSKDSIGFAVSAQSVLPAVGTQASAVELKLLEGGTIRLGRHTGKDIVVVVCASQFFNPFGNAAVTLRNIAERYRNRGVVVYLVNTRLGDEDDARREARNKTFAGVVGLDERREVAKAFGIDPASSTGDFVAVIDKQGVVQAVHDTVWPGKARLKRELDALLGGKRLLTNAPNRDAKAGRPSGK